MKSKFLKKLCIYAISASMILPASAPVMATTTTSVVRDYFCTSHTKAGSNIFSADMSRKHTAFL